MASDPRIRASDADRDRVAELLREHHAAGRLDADEFRDRLDKAYAAKTLGDLDELLADLPSIDPYQLPAESPGRRRPGGRLGGPGFPPLPWLMASMPGGRFSPAWRAAWGSWLTASLVAFAVWLLTGRTGSMWFLWVAGPWGAFLLGRWLTGKPARARRGRRRDREW